MSKVYTLNEAEHIIDMFEEILDKHNITVPSEEDDDRDPENTARLYGMEYWNLLEDIENYLILLLIEEKDAEIITGKWRPMRD